ncbi:MAG: hypothetical protein R3B49_01250 [Phycisphaerales bacterium]
MVASASVGRARRTMRPSSMKTVEAGETSPGRGCTVALVMAYRVASARRGWLGGEARGESEVGAAVAAATAQHRAARARIRFMTPPGG